MDELRLRQADEVFETGTPYPASGRRGHGVTPEFYRRASELFADVRDLPEPERSTAIASACGDDAELRSCVLHLMQAEQIANREDFLQARAVEDAAGFLMSPLPVSGAIRRQLPLGRTDRRFPGALSNEQ